MCSFQICSYHFEIQYELDITVSTGAPMENLWEHPSRITYSYIKVSGWVLEERRAGGDHQLSERGCGRVGEWADVRVRW